MNHKGLGPYYIFRTITILNSWVSSKCIELSCNLLSLILSEDYDTGIIGKVLILCGSTN